LATLGGNTKNRFAVKYAVLDFAVKTQAKLKACKQTQKHRRLADIRQIVVKLRRISLWYLIKRSLSKAGKCETSMNEPVTN